MLPDPIPETALHWHREGRGAVLVTVIEAWSAAPQRAGAQMVIGGDGAVLGEMPGGPLEAALVPEARAALAEGRARICAFVVADGAAMAAGLACGGRIRLLLEPVGRALPEELLARIVAARARRQPIGYALEGEGLARREVGLVEAPEAFRKGQSGFQPDGTLLILSTPPLRLLVLGGVEIARALLPMARLAGIASVLIDPRAAFANPQRFPGAEIVNDAPEAAIAALAPDPQTALVTLTHEPALDDAAIRAALASRCGHIAALGSRRSHAARCDRLRALGVGEPDLARIEAPAGLAIGAVGPAEIAVSVLAGVLRGLRQV